MRVPIAFCITELEPGGAERMFVELVTRLDRRRFYPRVYCLAGPPTNSLLSDALRVNQIETNFLGAKALWHAPTALWKLTRALQKTRPQIVQTFLFHANVLGAVAARWAGVADVVAGIRVAERKRWHLAATRLTSRLVDRHVCVSSDVAGHMEIAGLPADKLVVIPNGVDLTRFESAGAESSVAPGIPVGPKLVTFIGRLEEQKGAGRLIEVVTEQFARDPDLHLLVAGEGPLRSNVESAARLAGWAGRVHFLGWRQDILEILRASELLLLPSAWEGMPNVVLEAMAAARPVATFNVEGVRELLGPAAGPQIAEKNSPASLAESLGMLMENAPLRRELGIQNQRIVKQHFTLERMVRSYEQLYESLIARRN